MGRFKLKLLLERENNNKTTMLSKIVVLCAVAHVSLACFEFNTGYLGSPRGSNGVGRVEDIPTAYECQVACQNEPACEFWTWNSPDWRARQGICYFKSNKGEVFEEEDKLGEYLDQSSATVLNTTLPSVKVKVMEQDELRVCQVQWLAKSNAATTLSVQDGFGTLLNMKEIQMFAG